MKTRMFLLGISLLILLCSKASSEQYVKFARYPTLSPDGKTLAFCSLGDIWTVSAKGGTATRLTDHRANDVYPVWSPDGKYLAFSSDRNDNYDIFIMPKEGGIPKQLTFHTENDLVTSWAPDGNKLLFYSAMFGTSDLCEIDTSGGTPIALTSGWNEPEYYATYSPDGKFIAYNDNQGIWTWWRKKIKSPACSEIYILDLTAKEFKSKRITNYEGNDLWPLWSSDGNFIYYVSNSDGIPNIWKISKHGKEPKQITFHKEDGVQWLSISKDGKLLAYEYNFGIWTVPAEGGEPEEIKITAHSDTKTNPKEEEIFTSKASEYSLSPDGKKVAFVVRGELFVVPAEEAGEARRLTHTQWRESNISWSPDSKKIVYASDRNGNQDLFVIDIKELKEIQLTKSDENETKPIFSPDGKYIAYYKNTNKICFIPCQEGEEKIFVQGNFIDLPLEPTQEFDWSPDSKWITFAMLGKDYNTDIWVKSIEQDPPHNISQLAKYNFRPKWSCDGKIIYFSSNLNDHTDIYKIDLIPEEIKFKEDILDSLYEETKDKKKEEEKEKSKEVKIDFKDIEKRVKRVTEVKSDETYPVLTPDGKTFAFVADILGKTDIWTLPAKDKEKKLTQVTFSEDKKTNLMISPDGKKVYYLSKGKIYSTGLSAIGGSASGGDDKKTPPLAFAARVDIDYSIQREQMFSESWEILNSHFYDEKLHGVNWKKIKEKYQPILTHIATQRDFFDLIREMIGELNSSHLGIYYTEEISPEKATGYLGIELDNNALKQGLYQVKYIYPQSPVEQLPSGEKDIKIEKGNFIIAIDGIELKKNTDFYQLLNGKIGKKVKLLLNSKPSLGGAKEVSLKPVSKSDYNNFVYEDWVNKRRKMVDEKSNGKLGYLHIRAMDENSFSRFKKELTSLVSDKKGVIIDVRYNRGGHTGVYLLEILVKKPFVLRNFRASEKISENKYRSNALEKPTVLLINQHSFSNAEIFAQGFKSLNLGKVIGTPTFGGVIGTGEWELIDGTYLRKPSWGAYTLEGENLENHPRQPDIYIDNTLEDWMNDKDPQLERAIDELLQE